MARNLENSTSENSNTQEIEPRRSMRLNVVIGEVVPPLRGSTMAQAVPSKLAWARAQASHLHASRSKQPALVAQPAPAEQPTFVAQPTPAEQPIVVA
ncbi:hypothetical protein ACFX2J_035828 [Malus domestica]